jgi:hypothetical protein
MYNRHHVVARRYFEKEFTAEVPELSPEIQAPASLHAQQFGAEGDGSGAAGAANGGGGASADATSASAAASAAAAAAAAAADDFDEFEEENDFEDFTFLDSGALHEGEESGEWNGEVGDL